MTLPTPFSWQPWLKGSLLVCFKALLMACAALILVIPKNAHFSHFSWLTGLEFNLAGLPGSPFSPDWGLWDAAVKCRGEKQVTPTQLWLTDSWERRLCRPLCPEWWAVATSCVVSRPKRHSSVPSLCVCICICSLRHFRGAQDSALFLKGISDFNASCRRAEETCWVTTGGQMLWPELPSDGLSDGGAIASGPCGHLWRGEEVLVGRSAAFWDPTCHPEVVV